MSFLEMQGFFCHIQDAPIFPHHAKIRNELSARIKQFSKSKISQPPEGPNSAGTDPFLDSPTGKIIYTRITLC